MQALEIYLEDWQQEAFAELARKHGVGLETYIQWVLNERLSSHICKTLEQLFSDTHTHWNDYPNNTIEERLKNLFEQ
jgi:hypothetical protein